MAGRNATPGGYSAERGLLGCRRRFLCPEGGADNDEVYTFSLFHYLVGGVETRF